MVCIRCPKYTRTGSLLCDSCLALLEHDLNLVPEQLSSNPLADPEFYLIDCFGRAHGGVAGTVFGRRTELGGLAVLVPGVSRFHARIERGEEASGFLLRDIGSTNGTFLDGEQISAIPLRWGQIISVGGVPFFFEGPDVPAAFGANKSAPTAVREPFIDRATTHAGGSGELGQGPKGDETRGALTLTEASGGGGGLLTLAGASLKLTLPQFELLELLKARAFADRAQDAEIRGFVSTGEIVATISWDTPRPDDNNVKQLVRRVRSALKRASLPELIESAAGFGYRLVPSIPL